MCTGVLKIKVTVKIKNYREESNTKTEGSTHVWKQDKRKDGAKMKREMDLSNKNS